jgi:hypothetical protein
MKAAALEATQVVSPHRSIAHALLMSEWRTCWQLGSSALDFLSQFLRGMPVVLALPP